MVALKSKLLVWDSLPDISAGYPALMPGQTQNIRHVFFCKDFDFHDHIGCQVTANLNCNYVHMYREGCVIFSIYLR